MIQNRDQFLSKVATQLGRTTALREKPVRNWHYTPQHETLTDLSADELVEIFVKQCENIHTKAVLCTQVELSDTVNRVIEQYGSGSIVYSDDVRFQELDLINTLEARKAYKWQPERGQENITRAEAANVGIVVSDITLAESGTIVLQSEAKKGRTISFLPENSIAIIPKSSLVPRMTQAAQFLRAQQTTASCINFITGPSNSADIEMILIVGVHGPVKMTYIIVEDY